MGVTGASGILFRGRWLLWGIAVAFVAATFLVVARWPTTTRYGVNFEVFAKEIPLYEKGVNFVSRDLQARRLAGEITGDAQSDRARLEKIFPWVGENVRPVPVGFPIMDDHLWNVIVRGYGADDQRTEVFTLLASYSCCQGTFTELRLSKDAGIAVAIVELDGVPRVFDVVHQLSFRNDAGDFASIEDLERQPSLVEAVAGELRPYGVPYARYFADVGRLHLSFDRMELQKPWQRLKDEVAGVFMRAQ